MGMDGRRGSGHHELDYFFLSFLCLGGCKTSSREFYGIHWLYVGFDMFSEGGFTLVSLDPSICSPACLESTDGVRGDAMVDCARRDGDR